MIRFAPLVIAGIIAYAFLLIQAILFMWPALAVDAPTCEAVKAEAKARGYTAKQIKEMAARAGLTAEQLKALMDCING